MRPKIMARSRSPLSALVLLAFCLALASATSAYGADDSSFVTTLPGADGSSTVTSTGPVTVPGNTLQPVDSKPKVSSGVYTGHVHICIAIARACGHKHDLEMHTCHTISASRHMIQLDHSGPSCIHRVRT